MSSEYSLFVWRYVPRDGSDLSFEILCRKVDDISGNQIRISFRLQGGQLREQIVESGELFEFIPREKKIAIEFSSNGGRIRLFEVASSFGHKFYFFEETDEAPELVDYYDSPIEAINKAVQSRPIDEGSIRVVNPELESIIEEHFSRKSGGVQEHPLRSLPSVQNSHAEDLFTDLAANGIARQFLTREVVDDLAELGFDLAGQNALLDYLHLRIPSFREGFDLDLIDLDVRTVGVASARGWFEEPRLLTCKSLGELLTIKNFGRKSLLRFLVAIREWLPHDGESELFPVGALSASGERGGVSRNILSREDVQLLRSAGDSKFEVLKQLKRRIFPQIREGWRFNEPLLSVRVINVCNREGWIEQPSLLSGRRIGDLFELRNFGKTAALDLILNMETALPYQGSEDEAEGDEMIKVSELRALWERSEESLLELEGIEIDRSDPIWGARIAQIDPQAESLGDLVATLKGMSGGSLLFQRTQIELINSLAADLRGFAELSIKDQLMQIGTALSNENSAMALVMRLGLLTGSPMTLEAIGSQQNVTRERVRQKCDNILRDLRHATTHFPALDLAVDVLKAGVGRGVVAIERQLADAFAPHLPPTLAAVLSILEVVSSRSQRGG